MSQADSANKFWESRYAEDGFAYGTAPNDFLRETLPTLEGLEEANTGKRCLLLAEGEGRNSVFVAQQKGWEVVAVDYSPVGLQKAQALAAEKGVKIQTVVADLANYDLGSSQWDLIVGIFCHVPPPIRTRVLEAIFSSLRPGGYALFECYTPDQIAKKTGGPPVAAPMYSKAIFAAAFDGKLQVLRNEELVRDIREGSYHSGEGAVVQFVGRMPTESDQ